MKVLLDIQDEKAPFFMEVLENFKFVKAEPLTTTNGHIKPKGSDDEKLQNLRAELTKGEKAKKIDNFDAHEHLAKIHQNYL